MKPVLRLAALGLLSCLTLVSAASDRGFKPPASNSSSAADVLFKKIKTAANFGATGARIDVCPGGDCAAGQVVTLALSRLEELNASGDIVSRALNLSSADGHWSELTARNFGGITAMTTTYNATLVVATKDGAKTLAPPVFSVTAAIYSANGTAKNGNQSVMVPAGGVKFTIELANWPFLDQANSLRFAVSIKAKGAMFKDLAKPQQKKSGAEAKVDRLGFGEGMFMDAPSNAVVDSVDTAITASVETTGPLTEYVWVFPYFKTSLYYDPVVSSTDVSNTQSANETPTATTAPSKSSALPLTLTGVAATTVAALALVFF